MPTVLAGTQTDLTDSPENIVLYLIRDKWNLLQDGQIPAKDEITFSLFGWTGRKNYQISVEPSSAPIITPMNIGQDQYLKYNDPILIHTWIIKNRDIVPPQLHHITQRIEQVIFENVTNVGYGITGIKLLAPFSAIEERRVFVGSAFPNQTEISLWHSTAMVELLYFRVTTGALSSVKTSKTHKYDIEIIEE
ncbi:MAG: hypothetical protein ACM3X1_04485 [Ignavibacteriales bacterium]